jgi:hypothetical protein
MAILLNGTVYTVVGDQDFIQLQIFEANGTTPQSLVGRTGLKVRLFKKTDGSNVVFTEGPKLVVTDEDEGKITIKPALDEFTQEGSYVYYVDIIDSIGAHAVPKKEESRPLWIVAPKIGS